MTFLVRFYFVQTTLVVRQSCDIRVILPIRVNIGNYESATCIMRAQAKSACAEGACAALLVIAHELDLYLDRVSSLGHRGLCVGKVVFFRKVRKRSCHGSREFAKIVLRNGHL